MSDKRIHYFAYGSNMHPIRLGERVPSSKLISIATVSGYALRFHKRGQDSSAKCNMLFTGKADEVVHGVLYSMLASQRVQLDVAEGLGKGYDIHQLEFDTATGNQKAFCYIAEPSAIDESLKPFDWYKELVVRAVEHHGFPEDYIQSIRMIASMQDPDQARADYHFRLVHRL